MFKNVQEVFKFLVQQFRQNTGKFPIGKQVDDLMRQAEDYMSKPQITQVDEKKLPKAQIEALPLANKEKAEAAVRKKLEAQNVQAKQAKEGGETPGGPQRGTPELVDERFGQTLYIDSSEMTILMKDAQIKFDQAADAVARGDFDEARAILRFEIEDNYKLPQATRDAAYDARVFIRRGAGIDPKEMGYETMEETLEALNERIAKGVQTTYKDNWPLYTAPDDASNMKSIEYVDFLDEPGVDFGTPNSKMITPSDMDYEYATGGRVGYSAGGIIKALQTMYKGADISYFVDLMNQAKKAGIPIKNLKDLFNFEKQVQEAGGKVYESRKKFPGVPKGTKSGLPVDDEMLVPKTNLQKVRNKVQKDKEGIQQLADKEQIPVRDDTVKSKYRFTGRETVDDLRDLEDKGIVSRADINVYGDRYLDYLDARVKYYYGYTKGQMNKIKNQPARLNYLRAQVDPDWAEANFGENYLPMLEKARSEEIARINPGKDKSGPFDHIFEKMYKPVRDEIDKIPGEKPLQKTKNKRTLNASGGLAYLMGL